MLLYFIIKYVKITCPVKTIEEQHVLSEVWSCWWTSGRRVVRIETCEDCFSCWMLETCAKLNAQARDEEGVRWENIARFIFRACNFNVFNNKIQKHVFNCINTCFLFVLFSKIKDFHSFKCPHSLGRTVIILSCRDIFHEILQISFECLPAPQTPTQLKWAGTYIFG